MIAVDTNVHVYAHRREARVGDQAHRIMAGLAGGDQPWAIPWPCSFEFLSVVTNRRLRKDTATAPRQEWLQFRAWTESPSNQLIGETSNFSASRS